MAIVSRNCLLNGMKGVIGGLVFRRMNGKTVVSRHVPRLKKQQNVSALQQQTRTTFAEATRYAKVVTRDPVRYAHYKALAKKLKLSSAYTAAITDFMRKAKAARAVEALVPATPVVLPVLVQPIVRPTLLQRRLPSPVCLMECRGYLPSHSLKAAIRSPLTKTSSRGGGRSSSLILPAE